MGATHARSGWILLAGALVLLLAGSAAAAVWLVRAGLAADEAPGMVAAGDAGALESPSRVARAPVGAAEAEAIAAQYWRRRRGTPPRYPDPDAAIDGDFIFARVQFERVRSEFLGTGWDTDYPDGDRNLMNRFREFTTSPVSFIGEYPNHVVVTLYDEELFDYPFIFMSDAGTIGMDSVEVERLREYLLRGGFLWADDFWGFMAWDHFSREIGRALPPEEYPILDVPVDHPIRQMLYPIEEIPQIPSIQWFRRSGGITTSERGPESAVPHLRHISDENGRIMVLMSHNTDIADGWERENEDFDFFNRFSFPAYAVGINVLLYARSH